MTRRRPRCDRTPDLLDWEPAEPRVTYQQRDVVATNLDARICRAISLALRECGRTRNEVAFAMGEFLGSEDISVHMLNAYASEARAEHRINLPRFAALVHATGDMRLLSILPELFGCSVIPDRYLPAIEQAMLDDRIKDLKRQRDVANRRWKGA